MENITLDNGQVKTVTEVQTDLATFIAEQQRLLESIDREMTESKKRKELILAKLQQLLTPVENTVVESQEI